MTLARSITAGIFYCLLLVHARHIHSTNQQSFVSSEEYERTAPCNLSCEAQWKNDFQMHYGKMYDSQFYDIPLDTAVIASRPNLESFCTMTRQKYTCLRKECGIHTHDWTPERHICILHYEQFRNSMSCFKKTVDAVHDECSLFCNRLSRRVSQAELSFVHEQKLGRKAVEAFERQNSECHFIACHKMCHTRLIDGLCDEREKDVSTKSVEEYYDKYMKKDYVDHFSKPEYNALFSSFCRRFTPGEDEQHYVADMSPYNNRTIELMLNGIHKLVLDRQRMV